MTNSNVLAGLACPKCGDEGPFHISVAIYGVAEVSDDGFDYNDVKVSETEWYDGDLASCRCLNCSFDGYVRDFFVKEN